MDYSIGLKQIHQILSGLFVSSASDGKLVNSLDLVLRPKSVSAGKVAELNSATKDLLMCRFKNSLTGDMEWCSHRHQKLMKGAFEAYALSGLSAFPLPVWPFFGHTNASLNVFKHFEEFLTAYHPSLTFESQSRDAIKVIDGDDVLFVSYILEHSFCFSAFSSQSSSLHVSLYRDGFGACTIECDITDSSSLPINSFEELNQLQYEGNVQCCRFDKSSVNHSFSSSCFLKKGEEVRLAAENLLDYFVDLIASGCDSFDSEVSLPSILSITSL